MMPCYHFNIRNGVGLVPDEDGRQLQDLAAARSEALDGIRSVVSEEARRGFVDLSGQIEITDDDGNLLDVVGYDEAIMLTAGRRNP
jgi:hypothetical protein